MVALLYSKNVDDLAVYLKKAYVHEATLTETPLIKSRVLYPELGHEDEDDVEPYELGLVEVSAQCFALQSCVTKLEMPFFSTK